MKRYPFLPDALRAARFGIAVYLGVAFVAVVALVLAANFLVVQAASIEKTITIYPRIVEHVPGAPRVVHVDATPIVRRVDGAELQTAFDRYRAAVRERIETQSDEAKAERQAAADDLQRVLAPFDTRAGAIGKRADAAGVDAALGAWQQDADAVIALADRHRDRLRGYAAGVDALTAHARHSLDRSWKIFVLVITRQMLLQYDASVAEWRSAAAGLGEGSSLESASIEELASLEDRAHHLFETNESAFRRNLGADWYNLQRSDYAHLATLHADLAQQSVTLSARSEVNRRSGKEAASAIPGQLQTVIPAARPAPTAVAVATADDAPHSPSAADGSEAETPTSTQSVVYHDYAENDYLTGLPNRRQFLSLLHGTLEDAEISGQTVGVFFLDVDNSSTSTTAWGMPLAIAS